MTDTTQTDTLSADGLPTGGFSALLRRLGMPRSGYLFSPWFDFFCLGGGSVIILALITLTLPRGIPTLQQGLLIIVLMIAINQPHFAHSYQMFYRNFREKAFGTSYAPALRRRYIFAGIVVPLALVLFMGATIATGNTRLLAYGANLMFFLVGWHYVKQGYGILMVDAVQKRASFSDSAKWWFRVNGYACWMVAWIGINHALAKPIPYLGLTYYTLPIPDALYYAAIAAASVTTLIALGFFVQSWRARKNAYPLNGVIAYLTTLYLWLIFVHINPLVLVVVPTFHSLQYLAVVWRYQLNAGVARGVAPTHIRRELGLFIGAGTALGFFGFMGLPWLFDSTAGYDQRVFGASLAVFVAYIFINVHHYCMDNVMWRRGNPDVMQHVFTRR